MRKVLVRLKDFFREHFPDLMINQYAKEYISISNAKSSIYVGTVVSALEIWMLITAITGTISTDGYMGGDWIFQHVASYITLLITAIAMLVYAILYLRGKIKSQKIGTGIRLFFTAVALTFGIYISYTSYDASGKVFAFVTMEIFCFGLFVWHPANLFFIITLTFGVYLYLQNKIVPLTYSMKVNSFTLWIVLLMAGINSRRQRRVEAQKDENLEKINRRLQKNSLEDELTRLPNFNYFQQRAMEILSDEKTIVSSLRFVFMDIENFTNYNQKYGFRSGNNFLRTVGLIAQSAFADDVFARFSDDHFIALTDARGLEEKLIFLKKQISELETSIHLGLKSGIYAPADKFCSPTDAVDHARYACRSIKKRFEKDIAEYSENMDAEFKRKQYIINNIDQALKENWIQVYYQPVVWAESGKLCGSEALARWNDPTYGFLSPAAFIPVLEEYHQIHKLDMYMLETVFKDLRFAYDNKQPYVPVSINFSRLDFEILNPLEEINRLIERYGINKRDIHIEITESALVDSDGSLKKAIEEFRAQGFSLWLDDFGSGYSGLNALKDFSFDMMKIDMAFLSKFSENKKTRPILSSIVSLAKRIGMQTLTEGVESHEAYHFLRSIGCQRLQGYLFGKPMRKSEWLKKLDSGEFQIDENFYPQTA